MSQRLYGSVEIAFAACTGNSFLMSLSPRLEAFFSLQHMAACTRPLRHVRLSHSASLASRREKLGSFAGLDGTNVPIPWHG